MRGGDVAHRAALGELQEDGELLVGQCRGGVDASAAQLRQRQLRRQFRIDITLAARDLGHGADQLLRLGALGQVARGAAAQRARRDLCIVVRRQQQHMGIGRMREQALERAQPADARHGYVHHQYVRAVLRVCRHRGLAAVDLAHHDATRALEQQAEPHPHCGVIVGQKNADSFKCLRHAEIPSVSCVSAGSR